MTLYELNKLKKNLDPARKLQAKINKQKRLAESASPNITGMPHSKGKSKDGLYTAYIDEEKKLAELLNRIILANLKAVQYINAIDDEYTQLIFRYRFMNGYSWVKVAMQLGKDDTADSVRMKVNRYLEKNF